MIKALNLMSCSKQNLMPVYVKGECNLMFVSSNI